MQALAARAPAVEPIEGSQPMQPGVGGLGCQANLKRTALQPQRRAAILAAAGSPPIAAATLARDRRHAALLAIERGQWQAIPL